eukprot:4734258-Pleurochrysis_carterae.AAC.1
MATAPPREAVLIDPCAARKRGRPGATYCLLARPRDASTVLACARVAPPPTPARDNLGRGRGASVGSRGGRPPRGGPRAP